MAERNHKVKFAPFMVFHKPPGRGDDRTIIQGEIEAMVEADVQGYDGVFTAEHFCSPFSLSASPESIASAVAARTRSIRIGIAVAILPMRHPLRIAADWATLDIISDGRAEVGVGRGFNWFEFNSMGVDLSESAERFQEGLQIIRKAWTEERVTYHGKFYDIEATEMLPKPVQRPHPPMFYASSGLASTAMAARLGLGSCATAYPGPSALNERREVWLQNAKEAGFSEEEIQRMLEHTPLQRIIWVAETDQQALRECRAMLDSYLGLHAAYIVPGHGFPQRSLPEEMVRKRDQLNLRSSGGPDACWDWESLTKSYGIMAGSPATVCSQLNEFLDQVDEQYILIWGSFGGPPPDDLMRSQRLFAEKVMPHFK